MKIIAKGQTFNLKEEMFQEKIGGVLIYASNGLGKTTLKSVFQSIKDDDESKIEDLVSFVPSDVSELKAAISYADKIEIFDGSESENYRSDSNKNLIIYDNAQRIALLEDYLLKFTNNINRKKVCDVKETLKRINLEPKDIKWTIKSGINGFRGIADIKGHRADEMSVEWISKFKSQADVIELILFIKEFTNLQRSLLGALSNALNSNSREISLANKTEFETLFQNAREYSSRVNLESCPICLSDMDWDATSAEIDEIIGKLMEQKEIINFKERFDKFPFLSSFKMEETIKNGFPEHLLINLERFKWENCVIGFLRDNSSDFSKAEEWLKEFDELSKAIPTIEPGFEDEFNAFLAQTGLNNKVDILVTKKEIILNSKNPEVPAVSILSTGEKNLLSLGSKLSQIGKNNIIIFDDITNSNDFYNLHSILQKIDELAANNKIIMLTHDSNFIDQIQEVTDAT